MIVAVVAVTYTMMGGISAVIWTDVIQTGILFLGAFITLFLLIGELPDGLQGTLQSLKEIGKTNPFETSFDPAKVGTIWTGVVAMSKGRSMIPEPKSRNRRSAPVSLPTSSKRTES